MNRYEEILLTLVAARVAYGQDELDAVVDADIRKAADLLEAHFQSRDLAIIMNHKNLPVLLQRQAE